MTLQPTDVRGDLGPQALQPLLERGPAAVGVDADKTELAAPGSDEIVVPGVLVVWVVGAVMVLVDLDAQQRVPDESPVIHAPSVIAVAMRGVHRLVVHKLRKIAVYECANLQFRTHLRSHLLVIWEFVREAPIAEPVVMFQSPPPVGPVFALEAALDSSLPFDFRTSTIGATTLILSVNAQTTSSTFGT